MDMRQAAVTVARVRFWVATTLTEHLVLQKLWSQLDSQRLLGSIVLGVLDQVQAYWDGVLPCTSSQNRSRAERFT